MIRMTELKNKEEIYQNRIDYAMKGFEPTPEIIEKIIIMNDGLYDRFRMAYDDMIKMKQMVDEDIRSGRLSVSGYCIFPEYFFGYERKDGIPTADYDMLIDLSDDTAFFPTCYLTEQNSIPDYDKDFIDDDPELSWNIEWLNLPGLENHFIHYFMHTMFQDSGTFCPADIPFLKPEDLQWQITVQYEFFNK